jgi:sugar lactone lactonase YvrE
MSTPIVFPRITALRPARVVEGGRVAIDGGPFDVAAGVPRVTFAGQPARVAFASQSRIVVEVPTALQGGTCAVRVADVPGETALVEVGDVLAEGVHQVDSPVVDAAGNLYLTYSGGRGQKVPVSIYRVPPGGVREIFVTELTNPTSMAIGPDGLLYATSRFDGTVSRIDPDGDVEVVARDLGVACGLAFDHQGRLVVGDRGGRILRVDSPDRCTVMATLPPSVAAFHLAMSPEGDLYVTAPTLSSRDAVYRIGAGGDVHVVSREFGRPQGLAFDPQGRLFVVEALAGASGVYRVDVTEGTREIAVSGAGLVGVAFDRDGRMIVTSNDTAYRFG